jgi:uncharacterized protein YukE
MAETMRVDTDALRTAAPALGALSATVGAVLSRVAAALDREGACWGGDATGTTFAQDYVPASQQILQALSVLDEGLRDVGTAIGEVADNVGAAEGRAQVRLR